MLRLGLADLRTVEALGVCPTFQTFKRDPRSTDLMLNAVTCYLFAEKKSSLSVFLHAILPCPATLRPALFPAVCLQTFQFVMYINPFDLLQLMGTMRNTTPPSPPPSTTVLSVFQDNVCVPLSSGRRVNTISSLYAALNFDRNITCTSRYCQTKPLAVSTEMKCRQQFRVCRDAFR